VIRARSTRRAGVSAAVITVGGAAGEVPYLTLLEDPLTLVTGGAW
jgi:hypothetical protein